MCCKHLVTIDRNKETIKYILKKTYVGFHLISNCLLFTVQYFHVTNVLQYEKQILCNKNEARENCPQTSNTYFLKFKFKKRKYLLRAIEVIAINLYKQTTQKQAIKARKL